MAWGDRPGGGLTPLARWHARTGKTYSWLARESQLTERTISNAAAGKPISGGTVAALAKVTGIPVADLVRQGR